MDVSDPGSSSLTEEQKALFGSFQSKVHIKITSHGLTAADV
ncbi:hypothetical protein [Synechococcus sp. MIT S1220]